MYGQLPNYRVNNERRNIHLAFTLLYLLAIQRNTYQAAILTDGTQTFAVYNYQNITWVGGGANQNCDRLTGTRSTSNPNCKPGHVRIIIGDHKQINACRKYIPMI